MMAAEWACRLLFHTKFRLPNRFLPASLFFFFSFPSFFRDHPLEEAHSPTMSFGKLYGQAVSV